MRLKKSCKGGKKKGDQKLKGKTVSRSIFPVKMMALLKTRKYAHIFDTFDPSSDGNFGNKNEWNTEYRNFSIMAEDCPRGGIVFHRPKDFLDELWCDGMDLNEAERENAFLSLIRQLNLFVFCSRKGTAPRKKCFLVTNEPVYYAHQYFVPLLSEEDLTRAMISKKHDHSVSVSSADLSDIDGKIGLCADPHHSSTTGVSNVATKSRGKARKLSHKSSGKAEPKRNIHLTLAKANTSENISCVPHTSLPAAETFKAQTTSSRCNDGIDNKSKTDRDGQSDIPSNRRDESKICSMPSIKRQRNAIPQVSYHRKSNLRTTDVGGRCEHPKSPFSELDVNQSTFSSLSVHENTGGPFLDKETPMNQLLPDNNDYAQMLLSPSTSVVRRQLHKSPNQTTTSFNNEECRNRLFSPASEFLENYSSHEDPLKGAFGAPQSPSTAQHHGDGTYRDQVFDSPMYNDLTSPTMYRFRHLHAMSPTL